MTIHGSIFRWEKDTRYYETQITKDLFDLILQLNWGSIDKKNGQQKNIPISNVYEGISLIQEIANKRKKRGYHFILNQK